MTTSPVLTSVSHATRPLGSSRMTASSTPSEIWSAILSGWPSVTDSEVNRKSFSLGSGEGIGRAGYRDSAAMPSTLAEVDHERHSLQLVALTKPVFDEIGVVAGQERAVRDLDGDPGRPGLELGGVVHPEALAPDGRRLALGL